jgi:hypothetical protein
MADFLLICFTGVVNYFTEFRRSHVMVIGPIPGNNGSEGTGPNTIHTFDCKKTILSGVSFFNLELTLYLVEQEIGPSDMTRRTRAYSNDVFATRFQGKRRVEVGNTTYLNERYTEFLRHSLHGFRGNISVQILYILQHLYKLVRLAPSPF